MGCRHWRFGWGDGQEHMLLIGLKRLDFLGELFVLLIGVLKKLILLLEALFEFRTQGDVLLRWIGSGHLARSQRQRSWFVRIGVPLGRGLGAIDGVALMHDSGVVGIFVPAHGIGFQLFRGTDTGRIGHAVLLGQRSRTDINGSGMGGSATDEKKRGE